MEYGWNKINGVLEHLSKFHAAYNANAAPGMAMATGIVEGAVASYNATQNCSMKQRWQVAGALLYSLDKMKSWYAKGLAKQPIGTYVKILF